MTVTCRMAVIIAVDDVTVTNKTIEYETLTLDDLQFYIPRIY